MNKKTIVIVGGSAGAHIATEIFSQNYSEVLYLETYSSKINKNKCIADKILDGIEFLKKKNVDYFIATGDNKQREKNYLEIFQTTKKNPTNCIHSSAVISPSSQIGFGNLIGPASVIHTHAVIGNNTIINTAAVVEHDCIVKDFAQVSPNVTLCGNVTIGEYSFIGAGSVVIPKITIGKNNVIGAGSSVISDIDDNNLYVGVPAIFKKKYL